MRRATIAGSLILVLSAWTATGSAEEAQWRPVGAARATGSPSTVNPTPAALAQRATLGSPALHAGRGSDEGVLRTAHFRSVSESAAVETAGPTARQSVVRGQGSDALAPEQIKTMPREGQQSNFGPGGLYEGLAPTPGASVIAGPADCVCGPACSCFDPCCFDGCGTPAYQLYGSAEFLLWRIKDADLPPLVTTGTVTSLGVLGEPGTVILFGGEDQAYPTFKGGRFTLGWWFDPCQSTCAIEGSFFFLSEREVTFFAGSDGSVVLARPFFDVTLDAQNAELVSAPGVLTGAVRVDLDSRLFGAEINLRKHLLDGWCWGSRVDGLLGVRYLNFEENLAITENLRVPANAQVDPGVGFVVSDRFETFNRFYGGQVGAKIEFRRGRWGLDFQGKLALGGMNQRARIEGGTIFDVPGQGTFVAAGGLLAQPTNIGTFRRNVFAVVPEIGVNVSYFLTDNLRLYAGYTFLYVNSVLRAGDQIDFGVNPTQLPSTAGPGQLVGPARPFFNFRDNELWAHGVNFGLEYRY